MAQVTKDFAQRIVANYEANKSHYPITAWELYQLATGWLASNAAQPPEAPQPREVLAIPSQEQLIEWAVGWRGSDSREGLTGEDDMIERITYAIRAGLLATTLQDAVGVVAKPIAHLHADGYWTWKGTPPHESNYANWPGMDVYTTPPPGVDVGKLRELRSLLAGIRPEFGQPGSRDVDVRAQQNRIDAAIAIIDAAAPWVGNGRS